jgi:hypothetical protein
MKSRSGILLSAALFSLAFACPVFAANADKPAPVDKPVAVDKPTSGTQVQASVKEQTTCPIMKGAVDKKLFVDKDGKRIYVCCKNCLAEVKQNFDTIAKQMESEGITLAKAEPAKDEKSKK